jgi:hypothetical protein
MPPAPKPEFRDILMRLDKLSNSVQELRDGVRQAIEIADRDPEMSLTRARKVLEYVVRDVYERRTGSKAGSQPLEGLIQRIAKDGFMPRLVAAYANAVRELGIVGTHVYGTEQRTRVSEADVVRALENLLPILEWYFERERGAAGEPTAQAFDETATVQRDPVVSVGTPAAGRGVDTPVAPAAPHTPHPVKQHVLLDRRFVFELIMLFTRSDASGADLIAVRQCASALAVYDQMLIENAYGSSLFALLRNAKELLGDCILTVDRVSASHDEALDAAIDESAEIWSRDPQFQLAVARYERSKGAPGSVKEAVTYMQECLRLASTLDAAVMPHPDRWPLFEWWFEHCVWAGDADPSVVALPAAVDGPIARQERVRSFEARFGPIDAPLRKLVRYGPMPYPFPPALLRHYDRKDLAQFPASLYEFFLTGGN